MRTRNGGNSGGPDFGFDELDGVVKPRAGAGCPTIQGSQTKTAKKLAKVVEFGKRVFAPAMTPAALAA